MIKLFSLAKTFFQKQKPFISTQDFWETRYASGGNSGDGSYGRLAVFKANVLNSFLEENSIKSVVEFGCGDGHQLGLINYRNYIGIDISESVVAACRKKYSNDSSKKFLVNNEEGINFLKSAGKVELSISMDVLYHLIEDSLFENYMNALFAQSDKFVIIYSTNVDKKDADHVLHRKFTDWVAANKPDWTLMKEIENPYPGVGVQLSFANFFIYKKIA